jgi:hypothetical protein
VRSNNLSPRSKLMTFIGIVKGTKGYIFMRSPNNVVFIAIQALFDKTLFLKSPTMHHLGYTPVGLPPDDLQGAHNGPPDNENEDYGGGNFSPLPPIPYQPLAPQGPPAARQQPPSPSPVTSGRGSLYCHTRMMMKTKLGFPRKDLHLLRFHNQTLHPH